MTEQAKSYAEASAPPGNVQFAPDEAYEQAFAQPDEGPLKPLDEAAKILQGEDETDEALEAAATEAKPEKPAGDEKPEAEEPDASAELARTMKELTEAIRSQPKDPEPAKAASPEKPPEIPEHIREFLESEDPQEQRIGRAMLAQEQRVAAAEDRARAAEEQVVQAKIEQAAVVYEKNIEEVSGRCNPPLTEEEKDAVVDWLTDESRGTALAESLTFEQGVTLKYPGRIVAKQAAPRADTPKGGSEKAKPSANGAGASSPEAATVFDRGGAAGPSTAVRKPPDNEPLDKAIERGISTIGWRR